jgi:hypothetical protein
MLNVTITELTLQPPFRHGGGKQWIADLPPGFAGPSDSVEAPTCSLLRLTEDGIDLGPPHAIHADVAHAGGGNYSHWNGALLFSSSDGSDPNSNTRSYAVWIGHTPEPPEPPTRLSLRRPFRPGGGKQWIADLPPGFAGPSDTIEQRTCSRVRLTEDGIELGPAHAIHAAIEREGQGSYSHWNGALFFSASDGSDPNANGRHYEASLGPPAPTVLGFGSCHVFDVLAQLHARGLVQSLWNRPVMSYSPRETLQLIKFHSGQADIPVHLRNLAVATKLRSKTLATRFRGADLVFLELGASMDIVYGPFIILRSQILNTLLQPIAALGKVARQAAYRWYHQGLINQNEMARRDCAARLLDLIPDARIETKLASDIVKHARGSRQDDDAIARTICDIRDLLEARAMCVLSTQNAFTPDGRPITWPGNFPKQLDNICRGLGLPLLHQSRLVAERGGTFSLEKDLHHFTPQFLSVLGEEMLTMGQQALAPSTVA